MKTIAAQDKEPGTQQFADFFFVTNNQVMVKSAAKAYREYPTIVNRLKESGIVYENTPQCYAAMDNKFARSRVGIGESSNLAQLAMTYYWTTGDERYYDVFVIMSVLAQIIIDGCKREYEVSGVDEIKRIKKLHFMQEYQGNDFPEFMLNTRKIATTKNGKPRNYEDIKIDRKKLRDRINEDLYCPMNVLIHDLEDIKSMKHIVLIPTKNFFVKLNGKANNKQMGKIASMVEQYAYEVYLAVSSDDEEEWKEAYRLTDELIENINRIRISNKKTINRLIEIALGFTNRQKSLALLKMMYKTNKKVFLESFKTKKSEFFSDDPQKSQKISTKN